MLQRSPAMSEGNPLGRRPTVGQRLAWIVRTAARDIAAARSTLLVVFVFRFFYFVRLGGRLRTIDADQAAPVTVRHNLRSLTRKLDRMRLLIDPLAMLEHVTREARILVIGPRNEWDLLLLYRAGFDFSRCTGLDLISYSPRIVLGDMHAMPFADGEFDVVLCGWTLSYSADPALAAREISRVCRDGGVLGLAVEYFDGGEQDERDATGGYLIQDSRLAERVNSVNQLLDLFPGHGSVYFSHDAPLRRSAPRAQPPSNCAVLFAKAASIALSATV